MNAKISKAWCLLTVKDMKKARHFYEEILEQKVMSVAGDDHTVYEGQFALQTDYAGIVNGTPNFAATPTGANIGAPVYRANNFQLAFEVEDLAYWRAKLQAAPDITLIHDIHEYVWGQKGFRFYDHDGHIVEISERVKNVALRLMADGQTIEQIAEFWGDTVAGVQAILDEEW